MTLYDEYGNPVSLDLESVQSAIDTLGSLSENYDDGFEELTEASDIIAYYENYISLNEACDALEEAAGFEYLEEKSGRGFEKLTNNREMRMVYSNWSNKTRELNKRYRRFIKEGKFDEAQKAIDECQRLLNEVKADIKKMPAATICNLGAVIPGLLLSVAAFVSTPILKKYGVETKQMISVGIGYGAGTGVGALINAVKTWRRKVKEANLKINNGEDATKELNWCKTNLLNLLDNYQKQLNNCNAYLRKVKSKYNTKRTYEDADGISMRLKQIDSELQRSLKYDPSKAARLRAEKKALQAKMRALPR